MLAIRVSSLLLSLVALSQASCLHGTSKLPRRETAEGGVAVSTFSYTGLTGPLNWAGLDAANALCASGQNQSPINVDATIPVAAVSPVINIAAIQSAEFENLGSTVEVIANGTTTIGADQFNLKQFHFHTPSEHRVNDEYFPLEMHMVHEAADGSGRIAVLACLFEVSATEGTALISTLANNLAAITTPGTVTTTGALDMAPVVRHLQTSPLFEYTGSLTTPPCSEGVVFMITQQPLPIDVESFKAFKRVISFNSRFTQGGLAQENLIAVGAKAAAGQPVAIEAPAAPVEAPAAPVEAPAAPVEAPVEAVAEAAPMAPHHA